MSWRIRMRQHLKSPWSLTVSTALRSHMWLCFTSRHCMDSHPFRSMTIRPPISKKQFNLENSRSKIKVKDTPVNAVSCWIISLVFNIRASYQLPSPSFHDNRASYSRDIIWLWKFKVKGQGQRYPVSAVSSWLISWVFHIRAPHRLPSFFVPWQSGLPFPRYNLTLKIQGQRSRSKVP